MALKYSLANYYITISSDDSELQRIFIGQDGETISIGGQGNCIGDISISRDKDMYSIDSYNTGGYVFNKNLDASGSVSISINQLSDVVSKFKELCNILYNGDYEPLTISVYDSYVEPVAECRDCYPKKIPEQSFKNESEDQTWEFLVGQIIFRNL